MPRTVIGFVTDLRPKMRCTSKEPAITRMPMAAIETSKIIAGRLEDEAVRAGESRQGSLISVAAGRERVGIERFGRDDPHQDRHAGDGEQCAAETQVGRPGATRRSSRPE